MSLAHDYARYGLGAGNTAPVLPPTDRAPRQNKKTAVRRKSHLGRRVLSVALLWGVVLGGALYTVHRNTVLQQEVRQITTAREELAQLELAGRQLEQQLAANNSVPEVEKWALGHGMVRPKDVRPLTPDKTAVAARPASSPASQPQETARVGFWQTLVQYLASVGGRGPAAKGQ